MSVYGKAHLLDPSSSTCLTLVTAWLAGQLKFHFQDSATSRCRTSMIITDIMTLLCKESREKIRTYQEVCIYPEKECFLCDWYWSMAYTCIKDTSNEEYIFPEFNKTVCNIGESRIDSRVSIMFRKIYEHFYKPV